MPVELALESESSVSVPGGEDGPQGVDQLPHAGDGTVEGDAVALLDLGPHLGPESEGEPPQRQLVQVVGLVGQLDGIAGEGDGDIGHELDGRGGGGGENEGEEDVPGAFEGEHAVDPEGLETAGLVARIFQSRQHGVDLHRGMIQRPPTPVSSSNALPRTGLPVAPEGASTIRRAYGTLKSLALVTVPPTDVVTLIGPVLAPLGTLVVILVGESTTTTAGVPLKVIAVAPDRLVPITVTVFPTSPFAGLILEIVGLPAVS